MILCEFTVRMLWALCVSAPLPVISPRLQRGITLAVDNLEIWLVRCLVAGRFIMDFSPFLFCESPEILEVKNGI